MSKQLWELRRDNPAFTRLFWRGVLLTVVTGAILAASLLALAGWLATKYLH